MTDRPACESNRKIEAMIDAWMDWRGGEWPATVDEARELMTKLSLCLATFHEEEAAPVEQL